MIPFRNLTWAGKRDFPLSGGEHFYGSGRKTFSCEVNISGPQPLMREKFKLHCSLYLPDGTESRGLLDDNAWSWDIAGQHGAVKTDFISLPATLTFNFKKATGKLIMINISVLEVDNDPDAASHIGSVNTSTFWVKSKRRLSSDSSTCKTETGMKRTFSDSSEPSLSCEGSIDTVCKWTEIAMSTMNRVKRSRSTEQGDKEILMDAMSQCHILKVYEALDALRQQESMARSFSDSTNCISADDDDLQQLLTEFWDEAVLEQERAKRSADVAITNGNHHTSLDFLARIPEHGNHDLKESEHFSAPVVPNYLSSPPPAMNRIYSEGSAKGRVISRMIERLRPCPL
jgi:hypothetical protein